MLPFDGKRLERVLFVRSASRDLSPYWKFLLELIECGNVGRREVAFVRVGKQRARIFERGERDALLQRKCAC